MSHQNLVKTSTAFKTWQDEVEQTLLNASNFTGDRYTLLARSDWMNVCHSSTLNALFRILAYLRHEKLLVAV